MKRHRQQATVENPFVKPGNQSWELSRLASLRRSVSPPPTNPHRQPPRSISTAAVEAGVLEIQDHVSFFSSKLLSATRPEVAGHPRLSHQDWIDLYQRNLHDRGHHFVVHQHDHPVAGIHYDLRLQCNATSSISFAIMYGLPGDPNSRRLNRNATETRVHNLWNHLIETASNDTGTMLIWDTGEYTVLPYSSSITNTNTHTSSDSESHSSRLPESEPSKLHRAFRNRKIKLRLHGTRLPKNYTISLRLTGENNRIAQPDLPSYKRRRKNQSSPTQSRPRRVETSGSSRTPSPDISSPSPIGQEQCSKSPHRLSGNVSSLRRATSPPISTGVNPKLDQPDTTPNPSPALDRTSLEKPDSNSASASDAQVRHSNAYPGATNSINSIHQRRWYISLDRAASGFQPTDEISFGRRVWSRTRKQANSLTSTNTKAPIQKSATVADQLQPNTDTDTETEDDSDSDGEDDDGEGGFVPFQVLGRDVETSVITGRKAADVAHDEGLVGYRPRGGWKPVVE
ncbi:uncharacterized protein Z518_10584 [Rhinocladiella mackenziei CBS 650.93]|uniref:DNA ligase D 3'-phosphoesterase domain-containing protein n=1 Tax=Rhinocladiella mackenziei CBS 650.93 TaxID=1442369 RepID=A0A0D2IUQ0_9EURO|nr:uncharacterized protein Z518_10584 [Rhinocladiella mackenziei CBS 650.93]KIX00445.1 hypothetical protein Z518_10584 [Rhinocladiella mackenziei CBS 650.93]